MQSNDHCAYTLYATRFMLYASCDMLNMGYTRIPETIACTSSFH